MSVKRTKEIRLRLTTLEKVLLERKAANVGRTTARYCREVSLGYTPKVRFNEEQTELYKRLVKYHANFNRIANLMEVHGETELVRECKEVASLIRQELEKTL